MSLQGLGGPWDEEAPRLPLEDNTHVVDVGDVILVDMDANASMSLCMPQSANKPR